MRFGSLAAYTSSDEYLGKAVSSGHHLEAAQHSCASRHLLSVLLTEAVEGLPWQAGLGPGVFRGRVGVLFAMAHPEHPLCHIAAPSNYDCETQDAAY